MNLKSTLTFITILATTFLLMNNADGPGQVQDEDRTGSPLSEGACNTCHTDGAFSPTTTVELLKDDEPVDKYQPGETYTMKVTVTATEGTPAAYGFQAVALSGPNNDNTGSWGNLVGNINSITLSNGRTYVEHSTPNATTNTFECEWIAPQAGFGDVTFYTGGNAVNLDTETGGDGAAATQLTVSEEDPSSVYASELIRDFSIFPNPVQDVLNLKIGSRYVGTFDLSVLNAHGKLVQFEQINLIEGQNEKSINVSNLPGGLYLIQLKNEKENITQRMLKM